MTGPDREHCHAFVARLAHDGRQVWRREVAEIGLGVAHDVHLTPTGDLLAYGYATAKGRHDPDGFVAHLSAAGEISSVQTFGGPTADRALHARCFDDGSAMIVGYSQRSGAGNPDALWDLCLWKLDRAGKPVWTDRFGGEQVEFGRAIAGEPKDLWIVGHTASAGAASKLYLIRMSATG